MRDPARIDRVLSILRWYWLRAPDLRLGQIIFNAVDEARPHLDNVSTSDIFYVEDHEMEEAIKDLAIRVDG
jgi:uncharacterized protein YihD (DUF1040 family)